MALGGFDKEDFSAPMAEINTTPLVDVMLVLMVIFLVTAPMLTQAIKLELPSEKSTEVTDQKPITIMIDKAGNYYWNDSKLSEAELDQKLDDAANKSPEGKKTVLHIRADKQATHGVVSHVMAAAQRNGLNNIGFITDPSN